MRRLLTRIGFALAVLASVPALAEDDLVLTPTGSIQVNGEAERAEPEREPLPAQSIGERRNINAGLGRMLIFGFHGNTPDDPGVRQLIEQIRVGKAGGVIFFKRNITSAANVKVLTRAFRKAANGRPLIIGIDQEGGAIERLGPNEGVAALPSAKAMARAASVSEAEKRYHALAQSLKTLGFNMNFGPVVDLDINRANPIIGRLGRSFSDDPEVVAAHAAAFIRAHRAAGILTSLKHFPGHGSSVGDSHAAPADISASWTPQELEPYRRLAREGLVDTVMVGHLLNDRFDTKRPASLSPVVVRDILRKTLGSSVVVIADDMEMGAITAERSKEAGVIAAIRAGNSLVIVSGEHDREADMPARVFDYAALAAADDKRLQDMIAQSGKALDRAEARWSAVFDK
jgi:beta-N-acetylhexosaminidase